MRHPRTAQRGASACAVFAAAALGSALTALPARAEDRALLIGINKYNEPISSLSGSVNDVNLMAKLVEETWGFKPAQIKVLTDEQASAEAIRSTFTSWLVDGTAAGDRVLFYYSGHGYFIPDKDGDEDDKQDEVLVAQDAKAENGQWVNVVTDDEIRERLEKLVGRSVMVMADSCHSGTITRALDPRAKTGKMASKTPVGPTNYRGLARDSDKVVMSPEQFNKHRRDKVFFRNLQGGLSWTAVASSEIAQEDVTMDPAPRNGVFTRYFNEGLKNRAADADKDGKVTAGELIQYLQARAKEYCENNRCQTGMTPTFEPGGLETGRDMLVWSTTGGSGISAVVPPPDGGGGPPPPPPPPGEIIPAGAAAFGVQLELLPGSNVALGDQLQLKVTSSKQGYLVVLDVRDDGKVMQLFPSVCATDIRTVSSGAATVIPDPGMGCTFDATEAGKGRIMAIVSEDNVPLEALLQRNKGMEVIADASSYMGQIADALLKVWTGDERSRPVKWGLAVAPYEIK